MKTEMFTADTALLKTRRTAFSFTTEKCLAMSKYRNASQYCVVSV